MSFIQRNPTEWEVLLAEQAKPRTGLHVTDCLGCPRKLAGMREGWPVDLSKLEARLVGTIIHGAMSQVCPESAEVPVAGTLFGHEIVGSVDRLGDDGLTTCDYKTSEGGTPLPDAPYPDQVWQQEAYRNLLAQHEAYTVGWSIYYRRQGRWSVYEHTGPIWTEAQLAGFRPHGGAFTTAEIAGQCTSGLPPGELPLVGATHRIGKGSACDYCEVRGPCDEAGSEVDL